MISLLATSLATAAAVLLFVQPIFVFPSYQVTSFRVVDYSFTFPLLVGFTPSLPHRRRSGNLFVSNLMQTLEHLYSNLWGGPGNHTSIRQSDNRSRPDSHNVLKSWSWWHAESNGYFLRDFVSQMLESCLNFEIFAVVHAGISIDNNANQFGAHVHRAQMEIYHEDWEGTLVNIGVAKDRVHEEAISESKKRNADGIKARQVENGNQCDFDVLWDGSTSIMRCNSTTKIAGGVIGIYDQLVNGVASKVNLPENSTQSNCTSSLSSTSTDHYEKRLITIPPRQSFYTDDDALSITFQKLSSKTFVNIFFSFVKNWGVLHVPSSGVIQLKTTSSLVPLTVGVICKNEVTVKLSSFVSSSRAASDISGDTSSWITINRIDCNIERLSTGWWDIVQMGENLKELVIERHNTLLS